VARKPDYEFLHGNLRITEVEQFKAAGDLTRQRIISLLSEKAATTTQLSEALGQPKGSVGHHLKVLESAGLIRVVRTRQVRAMTEKYYGRTARTFEFIDSHSEPMVDFFRQAMDEYEEAGSGGEFSNFLGLGHARIPASKAEEFKRRVADVMEEFRDMDSEPGERVYGFLAQVYLTNLPEVPDENE
jgi:DNA-binding transcriptional ArsR family regulator